MQKLVRSRLSDEQKILTQDPYKILRFSSQHANQFRSPLNGDLMYIQISAEHAFDYLKCRDLDLWSWLIVRFVRTLSDLHFHIVVLAIDFDGLAYRILFHPSAVGIECVILWVVHFLVQRLIMCLRNDISRVL